MNFEEKLFYKFGGFNISYSQSGEDLIIDHILRGAGINQFTYLDIGTNHPKRHNNTFLFYKRGMKGVCVEPNPVLYKLIRSVRSKDKCLNVGVSAGSDQTEMNFYVLTPHTLSTFSKDDAEKLQETNAAKIEKVISVPVLSINHIIENYFDKTPDLISLDVEGFNEQIIDSFDFSHRPKMFCLETLEYTPQGNPKKLTGIINVLEKENYQLIADTYLNSIFIDKSLMFK